MTDEYEWSGDGDLTAIVEWLKAVADDAMGMEPGDRFVAKRAWQLIERQSADGAFFREALERIASGGYRTVAVCEMIARDALDGPLPASGRREACDHDWRNAPDIAAIDTFPRVDTVRCAKCGEREHRIRD